MIRVVALAIGLGLAAATAKPSRRIKSSREASSARGKACSWCGGRHGPRVGGGGPRRHPASVTKIASALALLTRLGPEHRFTTVSSPGASRRRRRARRSRRRSVRDPFLVDECAFLILRRLHALGLRAVDGRLVVHGPLLFDWQRDPEGKALTRALTGKIGAWPTAPGWPPLRDAALTFRAQSSTRHDAADQPLVVYRSPPLLAILKALDGYSNNVFHLASDVIGGPAAVEAAARTAVPAALRGDITIKNAPPVAHRESASARVPPSR